MDEDAYPLIPMLTWDIVEVVFGRVDTKKRVRWWRRRKDGEDGGLVLILSASEEEREPAGKKRDDGTVAVVLCSGNLDQPNTFRINMHRGSSSQQ